MFFWLRLYDWDVCHYVWQLLFYLLSILWFLIDGCELSLLRGLSRCVWVHVFAYLTVFLRVLLFAGSEDKTVRLWEVATQRELAVLTGHTNGVTSVAFDGSGKYLASGGARGATSRSIVDMLLKRYFLHCIVRVNCSCGLFSCCSPAFHVVLIPSHAAFVLFLRFVSCFFNFTHMMRCWIHHFHCYYCCICILLRFRSGRMIALFMLIATLVMILI